MADGIVVYLHNPHEIRRYPAANEVATDASGRNALIGKAIDNEPQVREMMAIFPMSEIKRIEWEKWQPEKRKKK